jgi:hypothetical protein
MPATDIIQNALHITIGSTPQISEDQGVQKLTLENDLRMVKAALLYADHSKLCSIASAALLGIAALPEVQKQERWQLLKQLQSYAPDEDSERKLTILSAFYEEARRKRYSKKGRVLLQQFETALAESWAEVAEFVLNAVRDAGGDGIIRAVESGLLEVHTFDDTLRRATDAGEHRDFVLEYVKVVGESVSDVHTYPLFDEDTSEIIRESIKAGILPVSEAAVSRAKESGLASDMLGRLPLFERATVREILDIRDELERPLRRFRSAIIEFSSGVQSAAWDQDFVSDADQIFRREVEPAILDLEEEIRANSLIGELARKALDVQVVVSGGSALALAVTTLGLDAIAALAVGGAVGGGKAVYDAYTEWNKRNRETEKNQLFFYYKAGQLLSQGIRAYRTDAI